MLLEIPSVPYRDAFSFFFFFFFRPSFCFCCWFFFWICSCLCPHILILIKASHRPLARLPFARLWKNSCSVEKYATNSWTFFFHFLRSNKFAVFDLFACIVGTLSRYFVILLHGKAFAALTFRHCELFFAFFSFRDIFSHPVRLKSWKTHTHSSITTVACWRLLFFLFSVSIEMKTKTKPKRIPNYLIYFLLCTTVHNFHFFSLTGFRLISLYVRCWAQ